MVRANSNHHINALTSIRFFAALWVVLAHFGAAWFQSGPLHFAQPIINKGFVAVDLFFTLSGVVLAYTYTQRRVELGRFWRARFARVYPLYLIAFLLTVPVIFRQWITHDSHLQSACNGPCNLPTIVTSLCLTPFMLQSWYPSTAGVFNPPSWSLSVEAFFYLMFPALLVYIGKRVTRSSVIPWLLGAWLASLIIPLAALSRVHSPDFSMLASLAWYSPLAHLPTFVAGMIVGCFYSAETSRGSSDHAPNRNDLLVVLAISAGIGTLLLLPGPETNIALQTGLLIPVWICLLFGIAYRGRIADLLSHPGFVLLGNASYAMYILQQPLSTYLRVVVAKLTGQPLIRDFSTPFFAAYLAILIVVSIFAYLVIERPARELILSPRKVPDSYYAAKVRIARALHTAAD